MEEERDREQFKHVCKLCNKKYPSGKSLGGHMRSHVIANSKLALAQKNKAPTFNVVADDDVVDDDDDDDVDDDDMVADQERENGGNGNGGGNSGYGLRENPKKTWRIVDSGFNKNQQQQQQQQQYQQHQQLQQQQNQQQERICKQCGKGFQSLKALCGHMSSHSEKDRNFKVEDDNSWSSESHSDHHFDHSLSSKRQTRSSMSRYRSITAVDSGNGGGRGGSGGGFGGVGAGGGGSSSNNSEIDQQEQEEVAMCLMMLSRDSSGHKTCFNLAAESSDNNSVILEGGSSSNLMVGIGKRKDLNLMSNCNKKIKQVVVVGSDVNGAEDVNVGQEMDNSDSGYFENGAKELESDDSVDGFVRNYYYYGLKKPKGELGNFGLDSPVSEGNYYESSDHHNNRNDNSQKGSKFECVICNKSFKNHQALGGHIISHRKNGESYNLNTSNSPTNKSQSCNAKNLVATTSTTTNNNGTKTMLTNYAKKGSGSKKMKGHKCPYCPKVFKSGQALGGHKRSHMIGGGGGGGLAAERPSIPVAPSPEPEPEPEPEQKQPMIDLNLPAPVEEDASGNSHFVAW